MTSFIKLRVNRFLAFSRATSYIYMALSFLAYLHRGFHTAKDWGSAQYWFVQPFATDDTHIPIRPLFHLQMDELGAEVVYGFSGYHLGHQRNECLVFMRTSDARFREQVFGMTILESLPSRLRGTGYFDDGSIPILLYAFIDEEPTPYAISFEFDSLNQPTEPVFLEDYELDEFLSLYLPAA